MNAKSLVILSRIFGAMKAAPDHPGRDQTPPPSVGDVLGDEAQEALDAFLEKTATDVILPAILLLVRAAHARAVRSWPQLEGTNFDERLRDAIIDTILSKRK